MARTSDARIRQVIEVEADLDLSSFITTAGVLTDKVADCGTVSDAVLTEIETYLAAHFTHGYEMKESQKRTGKASVTFQGEYGMGLKSTWWGQQAILLDPTGCLSDLSDGKPTISLDWLGTARTTTDLT